MTATTFSRQNDAGSRVSTTQYWKNLVLVVVLVSESKGLYAKKIGRVNFCKDFWDCYRGQGGKLAYSWAARPLITIPEVFTKATSAASF